MRSPRPAPTAQAKGLGRLHDDGAYTVSDVGMAAKFGDLAIRLHTPYLCVWVRIPCEAHFLWCSTPRFSSLSKGSVEPAPTHAKHCRARHAAPGDGISCIVNMDAKSQSAADPRTRYCHAGNTEHQIVFTDLRVSLSACYWRFTAQEPTGI